MTPGTRSKITSMAFSPGFTLVETIVVIAMLAVLLAIATPSLRNWRPNLDTKQTATTLVNLLREARSKSMATNFQYKVDFDLANRRYRMQSGSQAYNTPTAGWIDVAGYSWTSLSNNVSFASGAACNSTSNVDVQYNANGMASLETPWTTASPAPVTVCVQGGAGTRKYLITVSKVGTVMLQ